MTEAANEQFSAGNIDQVDPELFGPGRSLVDAAAAMDLGSEDERAFLATFPADQLESARAAIADALSRSPRVPVLFFFGLARTHDVAVSLGLRPLGTVHLVFSGPPH